MFVNSIARARPHCRGDRPERAAVVDAIEGLVAAGVVHPAVESADAAPGSGSRTSNGSPRPPASSTRARTSRLSRSSAGAVRRTTTKLGSTATAQLRISSGVGSGPSGSMFGSS